MAGKRDEQMERLIATVESMSANNQRAFEGAREELRVGLGLVRVELGARLDGLTARFDRFAETSGDHWRGLERRVETLESIIKTLVGKN